MARIYVDARCMTDEPCGVGRYALGLIPALAAQAPGHEFVVLRHVSNRAPTSVAPNVRDVFLQRTDDNIGHVLFGRGAIRASFEAHGEPDLYHALFHLLPLGFPGSEPLRPRIVTTVHDFIWLDHPTRLASRVQGLAIWCYARVALPRTIRVSDWVITVSQAAAERIAQSVVRDRVEVIHHGVDPIFYVTPPEPSDELAPLVAGGLPLVVAVANAKRYKNLSLLIRAFAIAVGGGLRARLVLVGNCRALADEVAKSGITAHTSMPGFVSDADLRALVGRATLFVHPSLAEGFGLPPLEAMALGTPTAVSSIAALREVVGDAALIFDPHDADGLAALVRRVIDDADLRRDLGARGRQRARSFTWAEAARKTLGVYEQALASGTSTSL